MVETISDLVPIVIGVGVYGMALFGAATWSPDGNAFRKVVFAITAGCSLMTLGLVDVTSRYQTEKTAAQAASPRV